MGVRPHPFVLRIFEEMFWLKSIAAITLIGIVNSWVSKAINLGGAGWYAMIPVAMASGAIWGWMSKHSTSLAFASTLYDIVYAIAYILGLVLLGDKITVIQLLGIFISIVGIIVMGHG